MSSLQQVCHEAMRRALRSARPGQSLKKVSFKFSDAQSVDDQALFLYLQTLVREQLWITALKPADVLDVAGVASLSVQLQLEYLPEIAAFCGYQQSNAERKQQQVLEVEQNHPDYVGLDLRRWGDTTDAAIANVQRAVELLTSHSLSRHQLSARLLGDAKRLQPDDMAQLLAKYPHLQVKLRPRRVVLNFHATALPDTLLIVENMDTYHYLQPYLPAHWCLVWGVGQRVTKQDIADQNVLDIHFSQQTPDAVQQACAELWQGEGSRRFYWGDLDAKGQEIFTTLQQRFANLQRWQPAYRAMQALQAQPDVPVYQEAVVIDELGDCW